MHAVHFLGQFSFGPKEKGDPATFFFLRKAIIALIEEVRKSTGDGTTHDTIARSVNMASGAKKTWDAQAQTEKKHS